jgi:putative Holliday junction resolvase
MDPTMKILAIDPGTRRLGLAACDELGLSTRLIPVLKISGSRPWIQNIIELIQREGFTRIIFGLPLNMNGSPGPAAQRSREMARSLQAELQGRKISCEVILWDERLTSFEAETRLREKGIPKRKAKEYLDSLAAEVLLQDYLGRTHSGPELEP